MRAWITMAWIFGSVVSSHAATQAFSLRQSSNEWWLVSPEGKPFFSLGICMLTPGMSRESYDVENPAYAWWQNYSNETAWAETTLGRLQKWNFTTVGAWSSDKILRAATNNLRAYTPVLHVGSTAGAPWWDMWDEKIMARMDSVAREQIMAIKDDPRLLGYYTDNEMGWWNATLFHMALEQPSSSGQRQRLLKLLREHYEDDWKKLEADFEPEAAENWDQLENRGQLWLRGGGNGVKVMRRIFGMQIGHEMLPAWNRRRQGHTTCALPRPGRSRIRTGVCAMTSSPLADCIRKLRFPGVCNQCV